MNKIVQKLGNKDITEKLLPRFLSYTQVWTTSDSKIADTGIQPSTEQQRLFAQQLGAELHTIGIKDVTVTKHAYVCARIPAHTHYEKAPSVCFLAHIDTVNDVEGKNVSPKVWRNYDGNTISLADGITLNPKNDECLANARGDTVITADGTTLLGADDKAGVAEIITACELLLQKGFPHGQIEIIFSPDEETGHGMDNVPLDWIQSAFCYTLDGGEAGELEVECFNAAKAVVHFTGKAAHTGTARGTMINAVTMASSFISMLPRNESPETTDCRQGFYAPMEIGGRIENAEALIFLRDFDTDGMNRRIHTIEQLAKTTEALFEGSHVTVSFETQYLNMKNGISKKPEVAEKLVTAMKNCGIEPRFVPVRGGTDGSRLTELGLPTPNIFTGGHNFHSKYEWASLAQMTAAVETIIELIALWKDV